jgi:hypothetical protein
LTNSEDRNGDIQHHGITHDRHGRDEPLRDRPDIRVGDDELEEERQRDRGDEDDHEDFEPTIAMLLQVEHDQHVERGDDDAHGERDVEEEVQRDRRPDHLGEVAGRDRQLGPDPEEDPRAPRVPVPARLGQIATGGDAEPRRERLQQDRQQVGDEDDAEERVPESRAAGEIGRPVARIHVADGDEVSGPRKRKRLSPPSAMHRHAAVRVGQRRGRPRPPVTPGPTTPSTVARRCRPARRTDALERGSVDRRAIVHRNRLDRIVATTVDHVAAREGREWPRVVIKVGQ